jgi:hypothetical protein
LPEQVVITVFCAPDRDCVLLANVRGILHNNKRFEWNGRTEFLPNSEEGNEIESTQYA